MYLYTLMNLTTNETTMLYARSVNDITRRYPHITWNEWTILDSWYED